MTGSVFVKTCYDKYNGVPYVWGGAAGLTGGRGGRGGDGIVIIT